MRRFRLFATFLLLVAGVSVLWNCRFERSPEHPVVKLADLRSSAELAPGCAWIEHPAGPSLLLRADKQHQKIIARLRFPALGPVDFLHVQTRISSRQLKAGKEYWEDGRGIIEWHTDGRRMQENDQVFSIRDHHQTKWTEMVMRPRYAPAVPILRFENIAISGDLEVLAFEATVIRERWFWAPGGWLLMAGWVAWIYGLIRPWQKRLRAGTAVVAVGWLFMGVYFTVPGPWKSIHSLALPFAISGKSAPLTPTPVVSFSGEKPSLEPPKTPPVVAPPVVQPPASETKPKALKSVGKIPEGGDFTLTVKRLAAESKWILHVPLLFMPVFFTACLVGRRQAIRLGVMFSMAVEVTQIGFGYGADLTDLVDLASDLAGIILALMAHGLIVAKVFNERTVPAFFATE